MDPAWQMFLTIGCMLGAWFWGIYVGIQKGSFACWHAIFENFAIDNLELDEEGNMMCFRDGVKLNPRDAWKK